MKKDVVAAKINERIVEVTSAYIDLDDHGKRFSACCPFHQEKKPSFFVTPARGRYKCFGCNKGGDAIDFIMRIEQVSFMEALRIGAKKLGLLIEGEDDDGGFDWEQYKYKESLRIVCEKAAEFFQQCLRQSKEAQEYIIGRNFVIGEEDSLMVGYAPEGNALLKWGKENGLDLDLMKEAGLISHDEERCQDYDYFRDRIMFPICEKNGKVIGFSGRQLDEKKGPKYLNSPETPIYRKGNELFGLNVARKAIMAENRAYLVEGNFDVKRLHEIGVTNTVAACGTALTVEQVRLLKEYTPNITLAYDGDEAGSKAIILNGEMLVKEQCSPMVMIIPKGEDPDSLFTSFEKFEKFKEGFHKDYIIFRAQLAKEKCEDNPALKSELIQELTTLICNYKLESRREVCLDEVSKIIKPKKAWESEYKEIMGKSKSEKNRHIIDSNSALELQEKGFFVQNNCYFFKDSKGEPRQQSNFILNPLFHVESTTNAKRLYEVINEKGLVKVVEIPQKDMVSLSGFQNHIESLGNFWFIGNQDNLNRLKIWLYENTKSCKEIAQLGWQKEGFWAWGNGIYNSEFIPVDSFGIVKHKEKTYYLPAFSKIFEQENGLFQFERKFIHMESNVTLKEYCQKFFKVFGDNAKIAICFYLASLFRDVVVKRFGIFPVLNLFGPKGAGKTACAESLVQFFGQLGKAPNINNITLAALGEHVASSCNAICHIDEYRNDIVMEKRELLKGLWDGSGRSKVNIEKDKKKEMASVDQATILTGQQMATADIALFSRFIFLSFTQVEFSDEEREDFTALKEIEKGGLTGITHQLLKFRPIFEAEYVDHVRKVNEKMGEMIGSEKVEDRIFNNWLIPMAAFSTLKEHLELPWEEDDLFRIAVEMMVEQNKLTKTNDDLGIFWKKIQFLISSNVLFEGGDYKLVYTDRFTRRYFANKEWGSEEIKLEMPVELLYISVSRVFSLYKAQCLKEGDKPLPEATVEYYLKNSPAFIAETKKESFKKIDPKTGIQEVSTETDSKGLCENRKKRTSTSALIFYLDRTGLSFSDLEDGSGKKM